MYNQLEKSTNHAQNMPKLGRKMQANNYILGRQVVNGLKPNKFVKTTISQVQSTRMQLLWFYLKNTRTDLQRIPTQIPLQILQVYGCSTWWPKVFIHYFITIL